jgi:hypothetical protein
MDSGRINELMAWRWRESTPYRQDVQGIVEKSISYIDLHDYRLVLG